ncbi:Gfo/Idh/MocA family protein [Bauldia sp.]|uniref:Gfo/Idh/MocA family protein n=1 Tax=Bauldia sp. TaxID=2575872 RepID=UPI003BA8F1E3
MKMVRVGLIGSGFMGRSHTFAFNTASSVFELPATPVLELLADVDDDTAAAAAKALGFSRSTGDWRALIDDPAVDLVDITAPNVLHKPIALAAIAAGKPVYCEKPLAANAAEAKEMADAADAAGVITAVGFNYLKNPMVTLAREIVASGEIGEVVSFRGIHAEDYMADPQSPYTWRMDPEGGHGVVADLGSHIISIARYVVGPIASVVGQIATVTTERPVAPGASETRRVEVDDQARALVRFEGGATGSIEASWIATGRKMTLAFDITGTKGTIAVDHERMNELQIYTTGQPAGREGFKTILAGPDHDSYAAFCPAPGHQLGFNDIKAIEVKALMTALAGGAPFRPDFREAWEIQRVVDAVVASARAERWVNIAET